MAIKLEMLRCFCIVAQTGNLAEAATRLSRTQSAISMTLKQLEENLGQRLFESDRKSRLTPLGEQVFELAQTQLKEFDATVRTIETYARSPDGVIRIASIPSVAGQIFPAAIRHIVERHPRLRIELRDTDTRQVIDALVRGQADFGVASGQHKLNGIREAVLFKDHYGLLCVPEHVLATRPLKLRIADLARQPFIHNHLLNLIETRAFRVAIADCQVSVANTSSLIAMVRTGHWVTVLPRSVVQFMSPDLVFRQIEGLTDIRQVSLLMREKVTSSQFVKDFWNYLLTIGCKQENRGWITNDCG